MKGRVRRGHRARAAESITIPIIPLTTLVLFPRLRPSFGSLVTTLDALLMIVGDTVGRRGASRWARWIKYQEVCFAAEPRWSHSLQTESSSRRADPMCPDVPAAAKTIPRDSSGSHAVVFNFHTVVAPGLITSRQNTDSHPARQLKNNVLTVNSSYVRF